MDNSVHRHPGALVADIAEEVSVRVIGRAVVPLFNGVIEQLGSIDSRLETLDNRLENLDDRVARLEDRLILRKRPAGESPAGL